MLSFKILVSHIYQRQDCERFNIDNIELRTGINIPSTSDSDCSCDPSQNIKSATFLIDTQKVDLDDYIIVNNFTEEDGLYINNGDRVDTEWRTTLNKTTGDLAVFIKYKN